MQDFIKVGGYTEDLKKTNKKKKQNCQNWEVGACPGQYGIGIHYGTHLQQVC